MMRLAKLKPYRGAGCLLHITADDGATSIYLGRRRYNPGRGKWSIPGGAAEKSRNGRRRESFRQAALRETWEETGVDFNFLEPRSGDEWPYVSIWLPGFRWRTYLVGLDDRPTLNPCHEFTEARWFRLDELPSEPAFGMKRALRRLRKLRKARHT